ncbi:bifunctional helix-turn-helix transcriptional regulator/GNAT family N-acetyltransferase [Edaphobacter albus]|uniref:bifunctional helix-turn-helix transcriptional regulator/GNAT family N-acetyltransferase n=1 Tax=Edaphobacter sp. 4G125 TaxID=2763071 RepID=UPI0016460ECE|nr:helix-turn-helix domain-containing GNAT family N-acetyltransferase [Edaphobacter sp. 4G125]QNI36231.1 MarR family transcriptional regulator [Edaphobacter sp. 4G125]
MSDRNPGQAPAEQIALVREFNRFYTARLGLLHKRHLDGEFSLTEARILYEIGTTPRMTASTLQSILELDAGYISRLLAALSKNRLIKRKTSQVDGREKQLTLTAIGEKAVARLNTLSTQQLQGMLAKVSATDRQALVASLQNVRQILSKNQPATIQIERLTSINKETLAIFEEYYDAVHVVQRDKPDSLRKMIHESGSGIWLAYRGNEVVGCVALRTLPSIPYASECKRLYVKPSARGHHVADQLLDAQEEFARSQGIKWIYLDSYDDLKAAIAIYERRGYQRCKRYNNNPQATLFMRKKIACGS